MADSHNVFSIIKATDLIYSDIYVKVELLINEDSLILKDHLKWVVMKRKDLHRTDEHHSFPEYDFLCCFKLDWCLKENHVLQE